MYTLINFPPHYTTAANNLQSFTEFNQLSLSTIQLHAAAILYTHRHVHCNTSKAASQPPHGYTLNTSPPNYIVLLIRNRLHLPMSVYHWTAVLHFRKEKQCHEIFCNHEKDLRPYFSLQEAGAQM